MPPLPAFAAAAGEEGSAVASPRWPRCSRGRGDFVGSSSCAALSARPVCRSSRDISRQRGRQHGSWQHGSWHHGSWHHGSWRQLPGRPLPRAVEVGQHRPRRRLRRCLLAVARPLLLQPLLLQPLLLQSLLLKPRPRSAPTSPSLWAAARRAHPEALLGRAHSHPRRGADSQCHPV